jgi:hypothetical protein
MKTLIFKETRKTYLSIPLMDRISMKADYGLRMLLMQHPGVLISRLEKFQKHGLIYNRT